MGRFAWATGPSGISFINSAQSVSSNVASEGVGGAKLESLLGVRAGAKSDSLFGALTHPKLDSLIGVTNSDGLIAVIVVSVASEQLDENFVANITRAMVLVLATAAYGQACQLGKCWKHNAEI